MKSIPQPTNY